VTPEHEVLPGVRAAELAAYLQRWLDAPAPLALERLEEDGGMDYPRRIALRARRA